MIILKIACNNLYMFKNFEVDFTYNRQVNHLLAKNDRIFAGSKIKVRKNLIVMGANASGKTTFGRLLCSVLGFIYGRTLDRLETVQYDRSEDASFEIEFVVNETAYLLKAVFHNFTLQYEILTCQKIYKSYDIKTLRKKLRTNEAISTYNAEQSDIKAGLQSYAFSILKNTKTEKLRKEIGYWFRFSEDSMYTTDYENTVDIELIGKTLPKIDNSISSVERLYDGKLPTNTYQIKFKNGDVLTVPDGDLRRCDKRLSHGTFESIDFILMLSSLKTEKLGRVHTIESIIITNNTKPEYKISRECSHY